MLVPLVLLVMLLIPLGFIYGGVWLSVRVYPVLVTVSSITMAVTLFVLLPNAFFSATPKFAGTGMIVASYVFGATAWVWSFLLTYMLWGWLGLALGLFFAGIGVVPLAMLATLLNGMWSQLGELAVLLVLTLGMRLWGYRLLQQSSARTHVSNADLVAE